MIDLTFEDAFDDLYRRAYGVAFQMIGRRAEAEDVAQETLARALVRWGKVRGHAEAWVVRVAGNLAIGWWRKHGRLTALDASTTPSLSGAATSAPVAERVDLARALTELSKRQRDVVVLRYLADLPERDVADALGCAPGTVKQHATRGLRALRSRLAVPEATADGGSDDGSADADDSEVT